MQLCFLLGKTLNFTMVLLDAFFVFINLVLVVFELEVKFIDFAFKHPDNVALNFVEDEWLWKCLWNRYKGALRSTSLLLRVV